MTHESVDDVLGDVWDTRDLIKLVESLEDALTTECKHCGETIMPMADDDSDDEDAIVWVHTNDDEAACSHEDDAGNVAGPVADSIDEDDISELMRARSLASEVESSEDFAYGATVVSDSYFEEYARNLASELGYLPDNAESNNPIFQCIDWGQWSEMVQEDYTSFLFEGTEYHVR